MINPPLIFTMIKRKKMPKKRKYSQADALRDAQKNYGGAFGKSVGWYPGASEYGE